MKKNAKKSSPAKTLLLSTATVRSLQSVDDGDLRNVAGGLLPTTCGTTCFCSH